MVSAKHSENKNLKRQLIEFWAETLCCHHCNFSGKQPPQFRPVGELYSPGGIVFIQINPGYIVTERSEIDKKYKSTKNRNIALRKHKNTKGLANLQKKFCASPQSLKIWNELCSEYSIAMQELWGWPPGKYAKTIESHGIELNSIAVVNLAQCSVRNNAYSKRLLNKCWESRTSSLLEILKPGVVVAQSKIVFDFLKTKHLPNNPKILEGVHHASRSSTKKKDCRFKTVKTELKGVSKQGPAD